MVSLERSLETGKIRKADGHPCSKPDPQLKTVGGDKVMI